MDIYYIIGIIISVLLTYWGIWHSNKQQKKLSLSLIDQNWITLINSNEDDFKSLEFQDYQLPTNKNIYYYKGVLMNSGSLDLHKGIIYSPLKIFFSTSTKLINFRITNDNADINVTTNRQEDSLLIEWDLLKSFEKFDIELIFETKNTKRFQGEIKLEHRIADLHSINRIEKGQVREIINKKIFSDYLPNYITLMFFTALSFYGIISSIDSYILPKNTIEYEVQEVTSHKPITLTYHSQDKVKLEFETQNKIINLKDLDDNITIKTFTKVDNKNYSMAGIIFCIGMFLVFIYQLYLKIRENIYENRMRKILKTLS